MILPNNFFDLLIFSLATWRVSSLLVHEDGPYAVFRRIRERTEHMRLELFWALFQCVWCTSVWIGAGVLLAWHFQPGATKIFCLWLSASAISIAWEIWCNNGKTVDMYHQWVTDENGLRQGLTRFRMFTTDALDEDDNLLGTIGGGTGAITLNKDGEEWTIHHDDLWYAFVEALEKENVD